MNTKKHKEEDITKIQRRREGGEWHRKRKNRAQILNFDFAHIEDEPGTDLEKQTVKKLAKAPSPQDILINGERMDVLLTVLPAVRLSRLTRYIVELTIKGLNPITINKRLRRDERDTRTHKAIDRGKNKIKEYVQKAGYLKYQNK